MRQADKPRNHRPKTAMPDAVSVDEFASHAPEEPETTGGVVDHGSVGEQARWAYIWAALANVLALAVVVIPTEADSFGFIGAEGHPVRAVLPVMMMVGLWLGFVLAASVSAVRIARLARWAKIDEDAAPISVMGARAISWSVFALIVLSAGLVVFGV